MMGSIIVCETTNRYKATVAFLYVNDVVAAAYDILNNTIPNFYNLVAQDPLDGVSFTDTFFVQT